LRNELIGSLRALADPEYQRRVWIQLEQPLPGYEDAIDIAIHLVLDDLGLDTYLPQAMGKVLQNDAEAEAVRVVVEALVAVLDTVGPLATAEEHIRSPAWPEVVRAAAKAYEELTGGQKPENMLEDVQGGWSPES